MLVEVGDLAGELLQQAGEDDQAGAQRQLALRHQLAAVGQQDHQVDLRQ